MKSLKYLYTIAIALVLLVGCGTSQQSDNNLLETIQQNGYITVATSPDFPPYAFIDPTKEGDAQYVGADLELARYIADALDVELRFLISDFSTALASLSTKKADIVISGLGYKEDRLAAMDFTKTYNPTTNDPNSFQGLMMKIDVADNFKTLSDFKGLNIGVQMGSLQEGYVNDQMSDIEITHIKDLATGVIMLQNTKIDALAITSTTGSQYIDVHSDLKMAPIKFEASLLDDYDGLVIGVQKSEPELLEALNLLVQEVVDSKLFDQWELEYTNYAETIGA